jgi:hypothetical protein
MNHRRVAHWIVPVILAMIVAVGAQGQTTVTCPSGPNQLTAHVQSNVSFDPTTKMYTYSYVVSNAASSAQEIRSFDLDFAPPASNFTNPLGWVHSIFRQRSTLGWVAISPPGIRTSPTVAVPPAVSQIKPGQSVGGFSFQSSKPPGPVKSYVRGYVGISVQADELAAETLVDQCPQSFGFILDLAVVGSTQGPVDFIPVQIEIKPPSTPPVSINPRSEGDTPVAILGTATFQVSSIDASSLRLGPGGSIPSPNQVHFEDVNGDGIIDLVAQFPTQKIGIRCNDTALFLTGKITSGAAIQGSEELQTVGCKSGQPRSGR